MARPRKFNETDILEKATTLFVKHGYTATSLSMLMAATGLQKGSIYGAFNSKEELFKKCLIHYMDRKYDAVQRLPEECRDGFQALETYIKRELYIGAEDGTDPHAKGCLIVNSMIENAPDNEDIKALLLQQNERLAHALDQVICQAQGEGHLRLDMPPEDIAQLITTFISGMHVYVRCNMPQDDIREQRKLFFKSICSAPQ